MGWFGVCELFVVSVVGGVCGGSFCFRVGLVLIGCLLGFRFGGRFIGSWVWLYWLCKRVFCSLVL